MIWICLSCSFLLLNCNPSNSDQLKIATSANMQFAIKELIKNFSLSTGIECQSIVSSSGKLTAQIKEGAPYDLFVSADMKFPNELFQSGLTIGKPKVYALGRLVFWTKKDNVDLSISAITENNSIQHIALANPKIAPYGKAALEILNHYHIFQELEPKLVYGESISQVNQFINSQVADLGFTSKSIVLSPQMKGQGKWKELDSTLYSPIAQGVVILKSDSKREKLAEKFSDFLFSAEGKEILNTFGYSTKQLTNN